jgi:hypothetical protein
MEIIKVEIYLVEEINRDIKINLLPEQFRSESLHFQNRRYKGNKSQKKIFIIFHS